MITASLVLYKTNVDDLRTVLKCVEDSCINKVYIIDNSPQDTAHSLLSSLGSREEYVFGHGNIGYGAAHNIALKKALEEGVEYHVILNPDISFEAGAIEKLYDFAKRHPDIGELMPDVRYPDGREQYLCKLLPTPVDIFGRRLLPAKWMEKRNYKFEMRETGYNHARNVPCLSGCFMFLNMKYIKEVGFFDDRFFMYFEDNDLVRRLHGVSKTVFYPALSIIHNHASEHHSNKRLLRISIQSTIRYFNKWGWIFDKDRRRINKDAFSPENIIED